ncbi:hydantoinase B/oxoprolinase family protein [Paenarthrobacter sp. MMS21-TAE1-1]|uniref:Hydantoinase B/oxoprolinase family protein n=1 Tax=Paenarthrobacter aromaticivorans TaxID=2849150 RepID=A0ABS6I7S6_9MICC|nr:hydantoinase B/oxoprolinase family protein [Paenarthrobacter sp. MMS21-TAE1-1]
MNSVYAATVFSAIVAIKHVFPDIPINSGIFEPLSFIIPESVFLNAKPPRTPSHRAPSQAAQLKPANASSQPLWGPSLVHCRTASRPGPPPPPTISPSEASTRTASSSSCTPSLVADMADTNRAMVCPTAAP